MSDPDFTPLLAARRVAIIGIGLIGGSLAYDLKGKCTRLLGVDSNPEVVAEARRTGIFDEVAGAPGQLLPQADFVVLAAPVNKIINLVHALPDLHPGEAVVLDLGSTKKDIKTAMEELPPRFRPVGGHPMAGKEFGGLQNAEPGLFRGAPFALVDIRQESDDVKLLVEALVAAIGAQPHWLTAAAHDQIAADISHSPYLVAASLARATPLEASTLLGTGFRSTARLAATPPEMFSDVIRSNRTPILEALARVSRELSELETLLMEDDPARLAEWLQDAQTHHAELTGLGSSN